MAFIKKFQQAIKDTISLSEIRETLVTNLAKFVEETQPQKVGFVAGAITAPTIEEINQNRARLVRFASHLNKQHPDCFFFSSADIFTDNVRERINSSQVSHEQWMDYWRTILNANLITDLFLTPGWKKSAGTRDEHKTAKTIGLNIHQLNYEV
ncbi:MAG: hypothetical protein U9Q63_04040 [Patescibacteria group bacterium]|nr:hypothetical protein [Patescibacteria group bacterium]